jgi:hypothetical protein
MDTQIWYSVFCTIFGGLYGILNHLGEVSLLEFIAIIFSRQILGLALISPIICRFEHWGC